MHLAKRILKGEKLTPSELKKLSKEELREHRSTDSTEAKSKALKKKCK